MKNDKGKDRITLNPQNAYGAFGGQDWDGGLALFPAAADNVDDWKLATVTMNGGAAQIGVGCKGHGGAILLQDKDGHSSIQIDGGAAQIGVGCKGHSGTILLQDKDGHSSIQIDGASGDIILQNADCAEEFEVQDGTLIEPGVVLALTEAGTLALASCPYDRKVAGVVSGAGGLRPGLVLGRSHISPNRWPIALSGKVFCRVDAQHAPVAEGDLLTTSATPGHAMAAQDPRRAFGAVIGKALAPLRSGQALVPILVALQ